MTNRRITICALLALTFTWTAAHAEEDDPWQVLSDVRSSLVAQTPQAGTFVQTFTPAGFSSGDTERGTVALSLPECIRWDYTDPFPKSFLLCNDDAYSWSPGDASGRRFSVEGRDQEGLDLLRLNINELRERYLAEVATDAEGMYEIHLSPQLEGGLIREAKLTVDAGRTAITTVSYTDQDGNQTLFAFDRFEPLPSARVFSPPEALQWISE